MWKIEKLDESGSRGRWVPASDARYPSLERAEKARGEAVREALVEAGKRGAWRTPRFRVVKSEEIARRAIKYVLQRIATGRPVPVRSSHGIAAAALHGIRGFDAGAHRRRGAAASAG